MFSFYDPQLMLETVTWHISKMRSPKKFELYQFKQIGVTEKIKYIFIMENNSCIKLLHICKSKINEYISGKYSLSEKKYEIILTTYEFWAIIS